MSCGGGGGGGCLAGSGWDSPAEGVAAARALGGQRCGGASASIAQRPADATLPSSRAPMPPCGPHNVYIPRPGPRGPADFRAPLCPITAAENGRDPRSWCRSKQQPPTSRIVG